MHVLDDAPSAQGCLRRPCVFTSSSLYPVPIPLQLTEACGCSCAAGSQHPPYSLRSPVEGLRVKHTPVPLVGPMLPNTMACTFTAVPCVRARGVG